MKKQKEQEEKYEIDDFEQFVHLWNIVPGGQGKGVVLLRKAVDAIQHDNYANPGNKLPSFLITGSEGKKLVARALVNSLAIEDIRECPGKYFENGIFAFHFFMDSIANTAHILTNIEQLQEKAETVLWKFLNNKKCSYINHVNRSCDYIIHCNGLIVMTAQKKDMVSDLILKATDYVIELQPFNLDELEAIIHQKLVFSKIEYEGAEVLQAIIDIGKAKIDLTMKFLKQCIMVMKAEVGECLDMEIVEKARRLSSMPVPPSAVGDDMPF